MANALNTLQERLLLYRIRSKRDAVAFGKLYDAYVQRVYRFVYFKVPSAEEAQDLTADAFLKLWEHMAAGKPVRHVGALVYGIARNLVADFYRERGKTATIPDDEHLLTLPDVAALAKIERSAELAHVLAALRLLKEEYRDVLIMRYIDGMSPTEIAPALGKSAGAVRILLHRSLETLRTLLTAKDE